MPESLSRMFELIKHQTSDLTTSGILLKAALITCSVFACVQLLSMLATRYGDANTSSKSFVLSLIIHCCIGLGWATVVESYGRPPLPPGDGSESPLRVQFADSESISAEPSDGRDVAWNSIASPSIQTRTRANLQDSQLTPIERPDIEKAPEERLDESPNASMATAPDTQPTLPPQKLIADSSTARALPTASIDSPELAARSETAPNSMLQRQLPRQPNPLSDSGSRPEPQRGASERAAPFIEDGNILTLPSDVSPESMMPKPVGPTTDSIRRRTSTNPVVADITEPGSSPSSVSKEKTGERQTGKFTRAGTRTAGEPTFDPSPPNSPSPASKSSIANDERLMASRSPTNTSGLDNSPQPSFVKPDTQTLSPRASSRTSEPYRARRIEQRRSIAIKNGGSADSERAVEASLRWMASTQESDGRWSASRHGGGTDKTDPQGQNRLDGGLHADTGVTGLVVLSFLGAGYTHDEGQYEKNVKRALDWLIQQQQANGYLGGKATRYDMMYCHAIATFAMAEACGMQSDPNAMPELREAVRRGVRLISSMQNDDGGWRYGRGGESDMSMFGWQLMALKSAVNAGIPVPEDTRRGMAKFLQARALGTHGGLAGYKLGEKPTPAMTAEALFCRQMFNVRPGDAASQEAVAYLRQNLPKLSSYDEYYWYYGTLAMFQSDGEPWQEWNSTLRDRLIGLQRTSGPNAGSWDPNGKWAGIGGRLYSTALSTMTLEVYYRFLRIYQPSE